MTIVSLVKCPDYASPDLEAAVTRAVDLVGGIGAFVKPSDKVLVKPNLVSAHSPSERVTTDPSVVRAVCQMVLDAGGRPVVADSPALEPFNRVAGKAGLTEALADLDVELRPLGRPVRVPVPEPAVFQSLELSADVLEADLVINLPKAKTHAQMLLTLGVKNLFGTVVAQRKAEWHAMIGMKREKFASLLIDIWRTVRPRLTVMDGVWGMEGRGPANGEPRHLGYLAASDDALAMDMVLCGMLGVPRKKYPLYREAFDRGLVPDPETVTLAGDPPEELAISDFRLPELEALIPLPGFLADLAARFLVSKPGQDPERCAACGRCVRMCASKAITIDDRRLTFDYDRCIRCYCCQEICPEDAITFRRGPIIRLLQLMGR